MGQLRDYIPASARTNSAIDSATSVGANGYSRRESPRGG